MVEISCWLAAVSKMGRLAAAALATAAVIVLAQIIPAESHFFGETRRVDTYEIVFAPSPLIPVANSTSYLNFSILENGTNIYSIFAAVVIAERETGLVVAQIPYRPYEFSDITIPYTFEKPGTYAVTLQARISGDEKYQATPLEASFDLPVGSPGSQGMPIEELLLFFVTPAAVAMAGIAIYLHSRKKP
jgi:hypothetical protein